MEGRRDGLNKFSKYRELEKKKKKSQNDTYPISQKLLEGMIARNQTLSLIQYHTSMLSLFLASGMLPFVHGYVGTPRHLTLRVLLNRPGQASSNFPPMDDLYRMASLVSIYPFYLFQSKKLLFRLVISFFFLSFHKPPLLLILLPFPSYPYLIRASTLEIPGGGRYGKIKDRGIGKEW